MSNPTKNLNNKSYPQSLTGYPQVKHMNRRDLVLGLLGTKFVAFASGGAFAGGIDGGLFRGADGSAATPYYSFNADPDAGIYRATANRLGLATNG